VSAGVGAGVGAEATSTVRKGVDSVSRPALYFALANPGNFWGISEYPTLFYGRFTLNPDNGGRDPLSPPFRTFRTFRTFRKVGKVR
jgi:hypothetical protein